jgi:hypothetical protein
MITLERLSEWIQKQELDEYTTKGLIELASRYPNSSLGSFKKNFNLMINRVRAKRKKEQGFVQNTVITKEIIVKPSYGEEKLPKTPELETPKTNIFSQGIDENEISENEVN